MSDALKLYNTRTRSLEDFHPRGRTVSLYTCGPTVYSTAHIGNLRSYIFSDILKRTLLLNGLKVKQVINVTDVGHLTSDADTGEDKLQAVATATHQSAWDIAKKYEAQFWQDIAKLNILPPNVIVKATDRIKDQIALINTLEKRGHTYKIADGIYFDVTTFPAYGQLSGQTLADKKAGARVETTGKKHPADFALWKFSPDGSKRDMEWPSPWGKGFPGWHIECSAIAMKELGKQIDIHTGGIDHIPVHHENEIAQSEAATGKRPFVNVWMHGEFLTMPGKRMGKSEGNAITLDDVIAKGIHPLAFRYLCLQTHYRKKMEFSWEALEGAQTGLRKVWAQIAKQTDVPKVGCAEFEQNFRQAISADLDTSKALSIMHELLKSDYPWAAKLQTLNRFDEILGLGLSPAFAEQHSTAVEEIPEAVKALIEQRKIARQQKDFAQSDALRKEIESRGFLLEDTPTGPQLRKR